MVVTLNTHDPRSLKALAIAAEAGQWARCREAFLRSEAGVTRRFIDSHTMDDFLHGMGHYSRGYTCECDFQTDSAEIIWDHAQECCGVRS